MEICCFPLRAFFLVCFLAFFSSLCFKTTYVFYSVIFCKGKAKCPSLKNKLHPYRNCTNQSDQSHEVLSIGNGVYVTLFVLSKESPIFFTILLLAFQYLNRVCFLQSKRSLTPLFVAGSCCGGQACLTLGFSSSASTSHQIQLSSF